MMRLLMSREPPRKRAWVCLTDFILAAGRYYSQLAKLLLVPKELEKVVIGLGLVYLTSREVLTHSADGHGVTGHVII
jgi:hypothetical protein